MPFALFIRDSTSIIISSLDPELRSISGIGHCQLASHVFLDNGLRHEQADPRSFVRSLGGKVGIKQPVNDLPGDASGVIGDGYDRGVSFRKRLYRNPGVSN